MSNTSDEDLQGTPNRTPEELERLEDEAIDAWEAVRRISGTGVLPRTKAELRDLVEDPLQEACGILYDLNIQTLGSSCNILDWNRGRAGFVISWDSLSESNRRIASEIPGVEIMPLTEDPDGPRGASISLPIGQFDTPTTIGSHAAEVASRFESQPMTWAPTWTLEEIRKTWYIDGRRVTDIPEADLIMLLPAYDYFVGPDKTVWASEEHYRKTIQ
jgi:hypothetical protein